MNHARGKHERSPEDESDGDRQSSREPSPARRAHADIRTEWLACPFYKKAPGKYMSCLWKYRLNRTSDVTQHLNRNHRQPLYCDRCGAIFPTLEGLSLHGRSEEPCMRGAAFSYDGISRDQRFLLRGTRTRGLTEAERWFRIWDIVFPKVPRPESPYVVNELSEVLQFFKDGIQLHGQGLVTDYLVQSASVNLATARAMSEHLLKLLLDSTSGILSSKSAKATEEAPPPGPATLLNTTALDITEHKPSEQLPKTSETNAGVLSLMNKDTELSGANTGSEETVRRIGETPTRTEETIEPPTLVPSKNGTAVVQSPKLAALGLHVSSGPGPANDADGVHDDSKAKADAPTVLPPNIQAHGAVLPAIMELDHAEHPLSIPGGPPKAQESSVRLQCPSCGVSLADARSLSRHMGAFHSKTTPLFRCPAADCDFQIPRKDNLRRHVRLKHGGQHLEDAVAKMSDRSRSRGRPRKRNSQWEAGDVAMSMG